MLHTTLTEEMFSQLYHSPPTRLRCFSHDKAQIGLRADDLSELENGHNRHSSKTCNSLRISEVLEKLKFFFVPRKHN